MPTLRMLQKRGAAAALAVGVFAAAPVSAQVPAGGEFQVNTYTTGVPSQAKVAADAAGRFVVAWQDCCQGVQAYRLYGRRFEASGTSRGPDFLVNWSATRSQGDPSVASDASGNFIVTWVGNGQGDDYGIFGQRFDASGTLRGAELLINTTTAGAQVAPSVAMSAAGPFVVVWRGGSGQDGSGYGIFAQRFDASGGRAGSEFQVNTHTTHHQSLPAVALDDTGSFVVVWQSSSQDAGYGVGVFGQRYDASGAKRGDEFLVNTYTTGSQYQPAVASGASGNFVVAWTSYGQEGGYPFCSDIYAQRYDATGTPAGGEFRVNDDVQAYAVDPVVAADAAGSFTVAWTYAGMILPGGWVYVRRYDAAGSPRGVEVRIDASPYASASRPSLASDSVGNLVGAWSSVDIYARRYGGLSPAAMRADPYPSGVSDGNDVLEPNENVGVWTWWRNVNGQAQTFGGEGLSFDGPAGSGVSYFLIDAPGSYPPAPNGETVLCLDCYAVGVSSGVRPAVHWDATFTERLTPDVHGQTKLWSVHIGDSFADVPRTSGYYRFVETLLHKGVTGGCTAASYCPLDAVTREQLSVFVLAGKEGKGYLPQACGTTPVFADVPASSPYCRFVEDLSRRGVVSGCGGGNYCPSSAVTREQMPVFVLRTLEPTLDPPACGTPMFADVPASSPFCRWIQELARRGVVSGCGGGNYCPSDPVTREQMAVFISVTFGLTLYGP